MLMVHQRRQLLHQKLQLHYGHTSFRSLQLEACESILDGRDTLLILPTGGPHHDVTTLCALAASRACMGRTLQQNACVMQAANPSPFSCL